MEQTDGKALKAWRDDTERRELQVSQVNMQTVQLVIQQGLGAPELLGLSLAAYAQACAVQCRAVQCLQCSTKHACSELYR